MPSSRQRFSPDRRQLLTGAGLACAAFAAGNSPRARSAPSPPAPIQIQTPDLALAEPLRLFLDDWAPSNDAELLRLSIVPAEPASDSLLNDARAGLHHFSGAFVPVWLIPDLVRDDFILTASPPPAPLPPAVAQLRAFGGAWVASDFDHDCDLLYFRSDLLDQHELLPARSWNELEQQASLLFDHIGGGIALPQTHAQQIADHFASMGAAFVVPDAGADHFWFDPETMQPAIASTAHLTALERWRSLARTTPRILRDGSTGDLWEAFIAGSVGYLLASADFLPYALQRGIDEDAIGIAALPGSDNAIPPVGNTTGASWGGVVMRSAIDDTETKLREFFESLARPSTQTQFAADPTTGVTPLPIASEQLDQFLAAGWPERLVSDWFDAIDQTMKAPLQLPQLRIAETRRYLQALENHIVAFLASDDTSAGEALAAAAQEWSEINAAIGKETQQALYEQSLMPPPAST